MVGGRGRYYKTRRGNDIEEVGEEGIGGDSENEGGKRREGNRIGGTAS